MINVIIDTREQRPWSFDPHVVKATIGTLPAGDYALAGDGSFAIERKSLNDFVGTISSGWDRFLRQLTRMAGHDARVIIVEGQFWQCCCTDKGDQSHPPVHDHCLVTPQFVAKQIAVLTLMRVSVLFAEGPELASGLAYAILRERSYALYSISGQSGASAVPQA